MSKLRAKFWQHYRLDQLNHAEWEALCDGCGRCCLIKLQEQDSSVVEYTNVACKLLDCQTASCANYNDRKQFVPDCIQLTPQKLSKIKWLPRSCAYRRIAEGRGLAKWHPLLSQTKQSVIDAGKSVAGRCISEQNVDEQDLELHLIQWVKV